MTYSTLCAGAIVAALTIGSIAHAQQSSSVRAPSPLRGGATATAGDYRPSGFMLGIHSLAITGIEIAGGDQEKPFNTKSGGGAEVTLGYGFTKTFVAFAAVGVAKQKTVPTEWPDGSWGFAHLELGMRANLPLGGASTIPYLSASVGARALAASATFDQGQTKDAAISGHFVSVGGGIEHSISRTVALDGGVDLAFGKLGHFKAGEDTWTENVDPTKTFRVRAGITWRPFVGR